MKADYVDILEAAVGNSPQWWDENGVPRFYEFAPERVANIYADEVCLMVVKCQSCEEEFVVAMSWDNHEYYHHHKIVSLGDRIACCELEYGDPPNINCCGSGPAEMSVAIEILEFWQRKDGEFVLIPDIVLGHALMEEEN